VDIFVATSYFVMFFVFLSFKFIVFQFWYCKLSFESIINCTKHISHVAVVIDQVMGPFAFTDSLLAHESRL